MTSSIGSSLDKNIDSLDALRGLACVMAILGHLAKEEYIWDIRGIGQLGVMIFFMLSGFLMAHLYSHARISIFGILNYATRRLFRILPAYLVVVFASYFIYMYHPGFAYSIDKTALIGLLDLSTQLSVFWTIPVEIKFYAFFPVIWLILGPARSNFWRFVATAAVFLVLLKVDIPGTRLTLTKHIEFFIGGVAAAYLSYQLTSDKPWVRNTVNSLFIFSLLMIVFFIPQVFLYFTGLIHHMWDDAWLLAPFFVLCLATCACITGIVQKLFANRFLCFIGTISYSLYLVHYPCIRYIKTESVLSTAPGLVQVVVALSLALCIAGVLYLVVENPLRKFGFRLSLHFSKRSPAA